ncbi:MAG: phenylalanine--tRNA ligase subunit alpha, partial [Pseudomonadales bacterium]
MSHLPDIVEKAKAEIESAADSASLDAVRVRYLGKKGELTDLLKGLGKLSAEERPAAGAEINKAKQAVQDAITTRKVLLDQSAIDAKLQAEAVDVTLPGRNAETGGLHPVTLVLRRIEQF